MRSSTTTRWDVSSASRSRRSARAATSPRSESATSPTGCCRCCFATMPASSPGPRRPTCCRYSTACAVCGTRPSTASPGSASRRRTPARPWCGSCSATRSRAGSRSGPCWARTLGDRVANRLGRTARFDAQREAAAQAIDALGAVDSLSSPLLDALHMDFAPSLTAPLVAPPDAPTTSRQHPATYLDVVASLSPDRLLDHDYGGAERPRSLLFSIRAAGDARVRRRGGARDPDQRRRGPRALGRGGRARPGLGGQLATPLRRLEASDPSDPYGAPIAFHLSQGNSRHLANGMRETLDRLSAQPPELLEELLRAEPRPVQPPSRPVVRRLRVREADRTRSAPIPRAAPGSTSGPTGSSSTWASRRSSRRAGPACYTSPLNGGYVHAPSVNQGAAAAVLRSVHLGHHAAGHGDAFSVDLSSERVRRRARAARGHPRGPAARGPARLPDRARTCRREATAADRAVAERGAAGRATS